MLLKPCFGGCKTDIQEATFRYPPSVKRGLSPSASPQGKTVASETVSHKDTRQLQLLLEEETVEQLAQQWIRPLLQFSWWLRRLIICLHVPGSLYS